jgi:ethanolamine transporter EutH
VLQILDARHCLAGAAVRHDAGEALAPDMEGFQLAARFVVDDEIGFEHGMITWGLLAPRCAERASQRASGDPG